jgi:hypothetical protein
MYTTAQSTVDRFPDTLTTTLEAKSDDSLSSPESAHSLRDITNPTIPKHQWNGDPMDWESWPTGRPGPFVSDTRMQDMMGKFQLLNEQRYEQSRTEANVLHIAEFSLSGQGESDLYRSLPELQSVQKYLLDTSRSWS